MPLSGYSAWRCAHRSVLPERFSPFTGPPFLPPTFLSLLVTTTCSSCPHGTVLCSGKQGGGRAGDAPATLKLGHRPKASSRRGSEPGRKGGGGGGPHLLLLLPQAASLVSGSLPCLWQLWRLEGESPFGSWLGLAKTWVLYPASSSITIMHLYPPGNKAAFYTHSRCLPASCRTSLPFWDVDV